MHFRRFAISSIPLDDEKVFADWVLARWREKDDLLQYYVENNRFPADQGGEGEGEKGAGWIESQVRPVKGWEWVLVFVPCVALALVVNVVVKMVGLVGKVAGR
jgi:lysocardiolipin and lysophospholipid acyltransferase